MRTSTAASPEKRHGRHYTPAELAGFLAERSFAAARLDKAALTVLDPACGDGELLMAAVEAARTAGYGGALHVIGYEIDAEAAAAARRRLSSAGVEADIRVDDFLACQRRLPDRSVDLVITNPPYVRTQHLGQEAARILANEFALTGRVDLTHPFVSVASRLLADGGMLGLLCSNRFLTTLAGENVRRTLLGGDLHVSELYDLGDTKLFTASVLPAVIIARKAPAATSPARYVSAYEDTHAEGPVMGGLFEALTAVESSAALHRDRRYRVRVGCLTPPADTRTPWRLSDPDSDRWLDSIRARTWKTFGEVAKIRVGIKTTADSVFIGDDWQRTAPEVEDELLPPLIIQSDIAPWRMCDRPRTRVLYPYSLTSARRRVLDLEKWPGAKSYLLRHEHRLRGRKYVIDAGREWYEIWVPQQPARWAAPKIVFPDISERPRFALDTTGAVVNGNCYWISLADLGDDDLAYLMLAVANSSLGLRYYDEVCGNRLYSGKRRWITQYVGRLPLPFPETAEAKLLVAQARRLTADDGVGPGVLEELDRTVAAAFAV